MPTNDNNQMFYFDYAIDYSKFEKFEDVLYVLKHDVEEYIAQTKNNTLVDFLRPYKTIPIQMVETENLKYDVYQNLSDPDISAKFGFGDKNTSVADRLKAWNQAHWSKKVPLLDYCRHYLAIQYGETVYPEIINVEISSDNGDLLTKNVDYTISGNKIYFFDNETNPRYFSKHLFLKNIVLSLEIGCPALKQFMPFEYIDSYSKPQYVAILKAFLKNAILGAQVCYINEMLYTFEPENLDNEDVRIIDFYNASNDDKLKYWSEDPDNLAEWTPILGKYSIFDAVVDLPSDYLKDINIEDTETSGETRASYLTKFLDLIRPAHVYIHPTISYKINDYIYITNADRPRIRYHIPHTDEQDVIDGICTINVKFSPTSLGKGNLNTVLDNYIYSMARYDYDADEDEVYRYTKTTRFDSGKKFDSSKTIPPVPDSGVAKLDPVLYDETVIHLWDSRI